jgi:hypothetical protein
MPLKQIYKITYPNGKRRGRQYRANRAAIEAFIPPTLEERNDCTLF